jgi:GT2 family glycosyltransferase
MNPPIASVVIPTRNRPQAVEHCLDALAAQTMPSGSFEVLVVDDGSEPTLVLDPARWASKFSLKLIHQKNTGPAGARNRGVAEARGEFLAFTDDDCLPTPTWLETLIDALRENSEAMVGGSAFNGLKENPFSETSQLILEMVYDHFNYDRADAYFFASNNLACRKDEFLKIGAFDVSFRAASEDRDLCDRWRMAGGRLFWVEKAMVEHRHAQSFATFTRIHFRYGRGAAQYKTVRRSRQSGDMSKDLGFHRAIPRLMRDKRRRYTLPQQTQLLALLVWWELVNALGFCSARNLS